MYRRHHPPSPTTRAGVRFDALPGESDDERSYRSLQIWHWVAAAIHGVSAVVLLTLFLTLDTADLNGRLYSDRLVSDGGGDAAVENRDLGSYELFWVLFPMPVLTSLFHVLQAVLTTSNAWYRAEIKRGVNPFRWIEYAGTASLMTWIVAQLSGITGVALVVTVGVTMNIVLQAMGLLHEELQTLQSSYKWVPMAAGFVLFAGQWAVIAAYFFESLDSADGDVPAFVQVIFFGLFFSYLSFPALQFCFLDQRGGKLRWYWYEFWFIVLSAVAKLLLDWSLAGGIISV